jgi:hypothetical protein
MSIKRGPGRPALPPEERRRPVTMTLSPETVLGLDVLAEALETSRSGVVERLVWSELSRTKPPRRQRKTK